MTDKGLIILRELLVAVQVHVHARARTYAPRLQRRRQICTCIHSSLAADLPTYDVFGSIMSLLLSSPYLLLTAVPCLYVGWTQSWIATSPTSTLGDGKRRILSCIGVVVERVGHQFAAHFGPTILGHPGCH